MMSAILVMLLMAIILVVGMATGARDAVHSTFSSTTRQAKSVDRPKHLSHQKLEKEFASPQKEVPELISAVKKLQQELDYMKTYSGSILKLTSDVEKLKSDFLALKTKTEEYKATENSNVVALQGRLDGLNTKIDNNNNVVKSYVRKLQTEINDLKSKTDNSLVLKSDVSKLQTETKGLKSKTDNSLVLKADVSKLQAELKDLKSKTDNSLLLKSDVSKLQTELKDLKSKTEKSLVLKSDVSKLQTETKDLKSKTDNSLVLKSDVSKLQSDIVGLKSKTDKSLVLKSDVSKLQSDFLAYEAKTDNNNVVLKSDVSKLQSEIHDLKSKTNNSLVLKSDVSKLQTETKGLKLKTDNSLVLKSDVSKLQTELEHLKSKTALLNEKVYFKATFEAVTLTVQPGTVVFDKVLVNWGFAYDPRFGIFTAPRAGLYAFTVQTFNFGKNDSNFDLRVNGNMILRGRSYTQFDTSNSYTLPIILRPGDHVHVYNRAPAPVYGYGHTLIAGWLIKAL